MGLELPKRKVMRAATFSVVAAAVLLLSGCSKEDTEQIKRLAMPVPATEEAPHIYDLWQGAWIAAGITGVVVWALIFYAVIRYRRRSDSDVPVQVRYNLPLEIFYTIAPIMMVIVFFYFTVEKQDAVLHDDPNPDHTITVVGQQWSWAFNYEDEDAVGGKTVHFVGTTGKPPTLYLVKDESVKIHLYSPDVIHSFWVPDFLFKMDVVPGRDNHFTLTPNREGTFDGRCAELCGVYHSRMLFNVKVVSQSEYDSYLKSLEAKGNVGEAKGGDSVNDEPGRREPRRRRVTTASVTAPTQGSSRTLGQQVVRILTTTDHKLIGKLYLITSFAWFLVGGVLALLIRSELAFPGQQVVNDEVYNQLFTMHGTIMLLLFATPLFFGFANVIMPLQIGSPDVAFPRLNMFSYWLFLFGSLITVSGFLSPEGAADFGWFAYTPLSNGIRSPGVGGDLWIMGLWMAGLGTILGAVNFITTIICMRAPGMTMFRMPIFVWNTLVTSLLVLIAFPIFAGALLSLEADRQLGAHVFDAVHGGPILWQHLFWFFGHPEVYIIALPFFGIITEILPVFSRKPIFGYVGLVAATLGIAILSVAVWAHHMFVTGAVDLPFFSGMTFLIAVPTGVKFFNWIGTMWGGSVSLDTPMLWSIGFLTTFLFGGLTGIILASPPLDFHVSDSYFVVAHFHYVVFGTVVFAMFAGFYFWWPKMTGRMLNEAWGKVHFWLLFIGFHLTFLVQHWLGVEGMPRRYADYVGRRRLHHAEPDLHDRCRSCWPPRCCRSSYNVWKSRTSPLVERRRPVGLGPFARVGDQLPAAAPQLRLDPADPFGVPGLRPPPPGDRDAGVRRQREPRRGAGRGRCPRDGRSQGPPRGTSRRLADGEDR